MQSSTPEPQASLPSSEGGARGRGTRLAAAALALLAATGWICVGLRYSALSAAPLHAGSVLRNVALLTLGHLAIGRGWLGLLARERSREPEGWAWCLLLGYGSAPALLWVCDRLGQRPLGWCALALLALFGLVLSGLECLRALRARAQARTGADNAPREGTSFLERGCDAALVPLFLLLALSVAALCGLDHIVYLRPYPRGVALTPPEDNLVHAAFALEWLRQVPFRHLMLAFTPEATGIAYHSLTDVQLASWWSLCGGNHLDLVHCERFVLEGFAFLVGLYLLARTLIGSRAWALAAVALFAALPFWFLDLALVPERESLQRLWTSFTFQNGAALGAGFVACAWLWIASRRASWARLALLFACPLFLAKTYFAVLAWSAIAALLVARRPRGWSAWLAGLALLGLALVQLQPHGPDIVPMRPEFAPGRFWNALLHVAGPASPDARGLANLVGWTAPGLVLLALGCAAAARAHGSCRLASADSRALALLLGASWSVFLAYVSAFWFLDVHQTGFQFLPWLAVLSILAGLAGLRAGITLWSNRRPKLVRALALAGCVCWALLLARAWRNTEGFGRYEWPRFPLTSDAWNALEWLRRETPREARILAPFESPLLEALPSPYAISGVAGRRAVDEHFNLGIWLAGLAQRMAERKQRVARFYERPSAAELAELARLWELDYVLLPAPKAKALPNESGERVFSNAQWCVLRLRGAH